eukprot:2122323-Alexandrium_andersonii.AAC.1
MSASLVGSEMCIRDRAPTPALAIGGLVRWAPRCAAAPKRPIERPSPFPSACSMSASKPNAALD